MKPIIGITCDYDCSNSKAQLYSGYYEAISACGGLPVLLPVMEDMDILSYLSLMDGLMLTGGQDVNPYYFDEDPHPMISNVNPLRDKLEIELCREAKKMGKPIFGICRGIQVMNIALGGDIYQDIYSQSEGKKLICHSQNAPKWYGSHRINIKADSMLSKVLKAESIMVNSFHHQAVRRLGASLIATGWTPDGIIESIESEDNSFFIGVQWHPEHMWNKDIKMLELFNSFVASCKMSK